MPYLIIFEDTKIVVDRKKEVQDYIHDIISCSEKGEVLTAVDKQAIQVYKIEKKLTRVELRRMVYED